MYRNENHGDAHSKVGHHRELSSKLLSVFEEQLDGAENFPTYSNSPLELSRASRKSARIASSLSCVSTLSGQKSIQTAVGGILNDEIGTSELTDALFDVDGLDDVEGIPALCNMSLLINKGLVRLRDLNLTGLRDRAIFELADNGDCQCSANDSKTGFQKSLCSILATGRSLARDAILEELLCGLLAPPNLSLSVIRKSLALVSIVLNCVEEVLHERDRHALLLRWARASTQQSDARQSCAGPDGGSSPSWSTELRGLAAGQPPFEFLVNGKQEEQALDSLFKGMNAKSMVILMSEVIGNVLRQPNISSIGISRLAGQFPRICVFVRLFGTLHANSDAEHSSDQATESPTQVTENLLSSAICSVQLANDGRKQAMIITLARAFFRSMHILTLTNVTNSVRLYEKWFLSILQIAPKPNVKLLVQVLQELIPLEPLPYLRCQIKCFRRVPSWFSIAHDYVVFAQTRSKDLDPSGHGGGNGSIRRETGPNSEATTITAVQDVCKFVVEFHRTEGKKIPESLVRQMNFHRHHFRNKILETLLLPDVNPPQKVIDAEFARGGIEAFDLKRIALIKILAYERRDRAITKEEADTSIPKIRAEIQNRRASLIANRKGVLTRVEPQKEISGDSSLFDVFEEFCNASLPNLVLTEQTKSDVVNVDADVTCNEELTRWRKAEKILCEKLIQFTDLATGAAEMLQLVIDRVNTGIAGQEKPSGDEYEEFGNLLGRTQYLRLWQSSEPWMLRLLSHALARKRQKAFLETLKLQIIAALCVQTKKLSLKQTVGIAVLLFAIVKFSEMSNHGELPLLFSNGRNRVVHTVTVASRSLPLDTCFNVQRSVQFAVCYLMLVVANSQNPAPGEMPVPGKYVHELPMQNGDARVSPIPSTVLPVELVQIVHWVLCSPWRLHVSRVDVAQAGEIDISSYRILSIVRGALSVTKALEVFRCKQFSLQDWINVEIRSGWGQPDEVSKVLDKFRNENRSSMQVVTEATSEISSHCSAGAHFPSWIVLGLADFAQVVEGATAGGSGTNSLSRNVQNYFNSGHVDEGCLVIRIARYLPPMLYFLGENTAHIFLHVQQILSPSHWPFSHAFTRFLLQAITSNTTDHLEDDSRENQHIAENPPSTLVAGISVFLTSLPPSNSGGDILDSSALVSLVTQVKRFNILLSKLISNLSTGTGDPGAFSTQALSTQLSAMQTSAGRSKLRKYTQSGSKSLQAVQQHPETLALGILDLAARRAGSARIGSNEDLWTGIEHLCVQLGPDLAVDVLDVAVDVAAQLPVVRARNARSGLCEHGEQWCAEALRELLRLRMQLWRTQMPFWADSGCTVDKTPFFVRRTREALGLVVTCLEDDSLAEQDEISRPLKRRRADTGNACDTQLHLVWQARIGVALGSLSDAAFNGAMQMCAEDGQVLGLLPMLADAVRSVRSADIGTLYRCFGKMRHAPKSEHAIGVLVGNLDAGLGSAIVRAAKVTRQPVSSPVWTCLASYVPHLLHEFPAKARG